MTLKCSRNLSKASGTLSHYSDPTWERFPASFLQLLEVPESQLPASASPETPREFPGQ